MTRRLAAAPLPARLFPLVLLTLAASLTGCPKTKVVPNVPNLPGDSIVYPITVDSVETENEQVGLAPSSPHLGGREQRGPLTRVMTRPVPGLPAPLDSMRDSALVAYLDNLKYDASNHNTDLKYVSCVRDIGGCSTGGDSDAVMFIQPEIGMRHMKADSVPPNGMVVARIINYGLDTQGRDIRFGVPGQRRAWWVVEHVPWGLRSRFFVRTYNPFPAVKILSGVPGPVHPFEKCAHPPAPASRPSQAKWATCLNDPGSLIVPFMYKKSGRSALADYLHAVSFRLDDSPARAAVALDGGWASCSQMCCAT
ncbi:MAG TPA: hypothetical protein VF761_09165 [Gemmatimonadaceae bacterium]